MIYVDTANFATSLTWRGTVIKMLILVLLLASICICLADFKAEVEEGPGTFLNTVPDGWFKNGEEGEAAGKIFFDILK